MPPIVEVVKLLLIIAGSIMEFARHLADIRNMMRKMLSDGKEHIKESIDVGKKHYHKKRRKRDA
jgi:uncharacterized protein (UPF0216 family)